MGKEIENPHFQHLSLTGVVCSIDYAENVIRKELDAITSNFFGGSPVHLHRKDLLKRATPFHVLRDEATHNAFYRTLFAHLKRWDYTVFSVVIDKLDQRDKYNKWHYPPYHYCLHVILERYLMWLSARNAVGDAMAEARHPMGDRQLSNSFKKVCAQGTDYIESAIFKQRLTSQELKLRTKKDNVTGLQLADLIAHPCFRSVMARKGKGDFTNDFDRNIAAIMEDRKLDRSEYGILDGYGYKWLP